MLARGKDGKLRTKSERYLGTYISNAAEKLRCPSLEIVRSLALFAQYRGAIQYILVTVFSIRDTGDYRTSRSRHAALYRYSRKIR